MAQHTIYLITGANRGIGLGLTKTLLGRPNTVVIAAVRDPATQAFQGIHLAENSKLIIAKIDSKSATDAAEAMKTLQKEHDITKIDTVIANAGISKFVGAVINTPISEIRDHFEVNTISIVVLFQAVWPLLSASSQPRLVTLSTGTGSIAGMGDLPFPFLAYGLSKSGVNYITRKISFEHPDLIAFPISPGWVQTDMGTAGAKANGMEDAPVSLKDSVSGILRQIDNSTKATSGTFAGFDGVSFPW
ncbi:NAD(P)-binding protein [Lipomyces orientalis]|uniref:NAD(P)-binding protein n=1 Tax=Lipomyces orientalis TaxID=1233043 RepID=A0ACC3TCN5_9ASCO